MLESLMNRGVKREFILACVSWENICKVTDGVKIYRPLTTCSRDDVMV